MKELNKEQQEQQEQTKKRKKMGITSLSVAFISRCRL